MINLRVLVVRVFSFNALQCFKDDLVEKAEKLGNEGKVEEAQGVMKLCEQLRKERYHLENMSNDRQDHISQQAKQMEVCPVCGAFLIVGDAESRQREHLMGKQHMGYAQVMYLFIHYCSVILDKVFLMSNDSLWYCKQINK